MDLLDFSVRKREWITICYRIQWRKRTGDWSLVAALQRAVEDKRPIMNPNLWANDVRLSDNILRSVFKSATSENNSIFKERLACIREAGKVLEYVNILELVVKWANARRNPSRISHIIFVNRKILLSKWWSCLRQTSTASPLIQWRAHMQRKEKLNNETHLNPGCWFVGLFRGPELWRILWHWSDNNVCGYAPG